MVDPFSVVGLVVIIILALSLGKILSVMLRFLYYVLIATLLLVFIFGITWNELLELSRQLLLLVF